MKNLLVVAVILLSLPFQAVGQEQLERLQTPQDSLLLYADGSIRFSWVKEPTLTQSVIVKDRALAQKYPNEYLKSYTQEISLHDAVSVCYSAFLFEKYSSHITGVLYYGEEDIRTSSVIPSSSWWGYAVFFLFVCSFLVFYRWNRFSSDREKNEDIQDSLIKVTIIGAIVGSLGGMISAWIVTNGPVMLVTNGPVMLEGVFSGLCLGIIIAVILVPHAIKFIGGLLLLILSASIGGIIAGYWSEELTGISVVYILAGILISVFLGYLLRKIQEKIENHVFLSNRLRE